MGVLVAAVVGVAVEVGLGVGVARRVAVGPGVVACTFGVTGVGVGVGDGVEVGVGPVVGSEVGVGPVVGSDVGVTVGGVSEHPTANAANRARTMRMTHLRISTAGLPSSGVLSMGPHIPSLTRTVVPHVPKVNPHWPFGPRSKPHITNHLPSSHSVITLG